MAHDSLDRGFWNAKLVKIRCETTLELKRQSSA